MMNAKPLNRYELEETFQKFGYIPHINKINVAGRIDDGAKNQLQYTRSRNCGEKLPMYRTILEIPSPIKIGRGGMPFVSHIPIRCVGDLAEEIASKYHSAGMFVQGTGRVQNYKVEKAQFADQRQIELLMNVLRVNDSEDKLVQEILNILDMNGQKDSRLMTTVAAQQFSLSDEGAFINEAILQGLIYMPPSLRRTQKTNTAALHIKMWIKRAGDIGPVPDSATADRDIVNIMFYGEKAIELYPKLKQGYPILVKGRLESDTYRAEINASGEQKKKIANLLGVTEQHPILGKILTNCGIKNKLRLFVKHDILGNSLETSNFLPEEAA